MIGLILAVVVAMLACPVAASGADSRAEVATGVAWMHSFEYERALAAFQRAEAADPRNAMAYWGQAMCYQQLLWGNENVEEARAILARMRRRGALAAASERDRQWLGTLDALFGEGDRASRLAAFASALGELAARHPADSDASAFHGLALMATRARGLAGATHAPHEELPQLAGSREQQLAAQIFARILQQHPRHPAALHYLIHAWDDPDNAEKALDAARAYASAVPESSHARHMPAHVFVQLGMWNDAIASDEAAAAAADVKVVTDGLPVTAADFHPRSWLVYEYTQAGRFSDARRAMEPLQKAADATKDPRLLSLVATLRSRLAIEEGNWTALPGPDFVNYDELFAIAFSAARRGDTGLADRARIRLAALAAQPRYAARRALLDIMRLQIGAAIRARNGDVDGALGLLAEAVGKERGLPRSIGPPALIKPAQEQHAEVLLQAGRPSEAIAQFEGALERARNRRLSREGLERARSAATSTATGSELSGSVAGVAGGLMLLVVVFLVRRGRARPA
jgi:tetratricopeptide (TPR) repeat protein